MSDDFTVRLCKLVQGYPELYDIFNDNFRNEDAKNSAWKLISTELGVPQSKCVIKWKSLKHQFVKAKKDQNTAWDLWPALQFLDESADKGGPRQRKSMASSIGPENADLVDRGSRKRKRESTAAATHPDAATELMDSTPSKSSERPPARKVAARGKQAASNSPQDTTGLAGATMAHISPQSFLSEIPYSFWSTSPVKADASTVAPAVNEPSSASSSKLSQTKATFGHDESAAEAPPANKVVSFSQAKSSIQETAKNPNTEPWDAVPTVSPQDSKPQTTEAKATPRGRRSTRVTIAETIPEGQEGATALAPTQSPVKAPKARQPSSQETPEGVSAEPVALAPTNAPVSKPQPAGKATPRGRRSTSIQETSESLSAEPVALAPTNSPVSKPQPAAKATPRGRRSTRVTVAETIAEEAQEFAAGPSRSPWKEPRAKQPRIEGNGIADVDPLADMQFESALDHKFFKQLQEKFAKLRPEVVSTMKASIFALLDNAART